MVIKSSITSMFGSSPIRPLQQHMEKVHSCVCELTPFFEAIIAKDFDLVAKTQKRISSLENEADKLKHDLRVHLPKSLFMPMPREHVLEVLTTQDQIANKSKDIAGVVTGRKMQLPDPIAELFLAFVVRCVDASAQAVVVVNELDELVETGFRGGEVKRVEKMIGKLHKIEHETDKLEQQVRHALFAIETDYPPVDVIFLYRIIDWVGEVADLSQRVGTRLQLMLAR